MANVNAGGSAPDSGFPTPAPIAPQPATWIIIIGAAFGLVTLVGLFAFAYLSAINPQLCSSFQFQLLAGGFALGAALAGGFIGGGAGAQGKLGSSGFNLLFGLTGGAALLVVTLAVFSYFAPKGCDLVGTEQLRNQLAETQASLKAANAALSQTKASLDDALAAKASAITERDTATSANAAARGEIKRLVAAIKAVLPDADGLSTSLGSITNLVTQSCSGGPHGTDPLHANEIRTISSDAARRVSSAQTAINNIVESVPVELRN